MRKVLFILGQLSDSDVEWLAKNGRREKVLQGAELIRYGVRIETLYFVLDGEMEVLKKSRRGRETRVAILGPNDCFGEMSIIDMQPRSATVRTLGATRLLKISTEEMDALYRHDLKSYTLIVLNIARDLSRRLRVTDGLLADFTATVIEEYVQTPSNAKPKPTVG